MIYNKLRIKRLDIPFIIKKYDFLRKSIIIYIFTSINNKYEIQSFLLILSLIFQTWGYVIEAFVRTFGEFLPIHYKYPFHNKEEKEKKLKRWGKERRGREKNGKEGEKKKKGEGGGRRGRRREKGHTVRVPCSGGVYNFLNSNNN